MVAKLDPATIYCMDYKPTGEGSGGQMKANSANGAELVKSAIIPLIVCNFPHSQPTLEKAKSSHRFQISFIII